MSVITGYNLLSFVYACKKSENSRRIIHRILFIFRDCMEAICYHFCMEASISCYVKSVVINVNPYVNLYPPDTDQGLIFLNFLLFSEL